jgi:hypothetical protein
MELTLKAKGFTLVTVVVILDAVALIHATELIHTLSYLAALNAELTVLTGVATIFVPEGVRSHLKSVADVIALHPYTNFYTLVGILTIVIVKFTKLIDQLR